MRASSMNTVAPLRFRFCDRLSLRSILSGTSGRILDHDRKVRYDFRGFVLRKHLFQSAQTRLFFRYLRTVGERAAPMLESATAEIPNTIINSMN